VPIELRILTGARGGYRERFAKRTIALGRHAKSDLRFDPNHDLDVSVRHAEIVEHRAGEYRVRDLRSTNGTFLNGERLTREARLRDSDVLWLGAEGPRVEVHLVAVATDGAAVRRTPEGATALRIRAAVIRETAALRRILVGAIVLALVGAGVRYWLTHRQPSPKERGSQERAR
jgi:pSer/pThr/pTyr-binding forkhead associated (FHA) protein